MVVAESVHVLSELRLKLLDMPGKRNRKKIDHNTYAERQLDGTIVITLHKTNIVTMDVKGNIILTSGGWKTSTTKNRLNNIIGSFAHIHQEKGQWYIGQRGSGQVVPFEDEMELTIRRLVPSKRSNNAGKKQDILRKRVKQYVKEFITALREGKIDPPSEADCWYCYFQKDGKSLGDATNNHEHILNHVKEKYFVPSLLVNALNDCNAGSAYGYIVQSAWNKQPQQVSDFVWQSISRMVFRYVARRIGLPT